MPTTPEALVRELDGTKSSSIIHARLDEVSDLIVKAASLASENKKSSVSNEAERGDDADKKSLPSQIVKIQIHTQQGGPQLSHFSLGVNGTHGSFPLVDIPPSTLTANHEKHNTIEIHVDAHRKGLFARRRTEHEGPAFKKVKADILDQFNNEMQRRMGEIDQVASKVEDILSSVAQVSSHTKVETQIRSTIEHGYAFPQPLVEKFSSEKYIRPKPNEQDPPSNEEQELTHTEEDLFEYTKDLASQAGAAPTAADAAHAAEFGKGKKKKRFQPMEPAAEKTRKAPLIPNVISVSSSSSASAAEAQKMSSVETGTQATVAKDDAKPQKKANPYVLKPSRQGFGVQSTSYVPK
jgi:hypothetical protein